MQQKWRSGQDETKGTGEGLNAPDGKDGVDVGHSDLREGDDAPDEFDSRKKPSSDTRSGDEEQSGDLETHVCQGCVAKSSVIRQTRGSGRERGNADVQPM